VFKCAEKQQGDATEETIRKAVSALIAADEDSIEVLCVYDKGQSVIVLLHPLTAENKGALRTAKKLAEDLSKALSNDSSRSGGRTPGNLSLPGKHDVKVDERSAATGLFGRRVVTMGPLPEQAATILSRILEVLCGV
jgi:hypothetical protein